MNTINTIKPSGISDITDAVVLSAAMSTNDTLWSDTVATWSDATVKWGIWGIQNYVYNSISPQMNIENIKGKGNIRNLKP